MILFATAAIAVRDPIRLMTLLVMTPALLAIAVIDLEQGDIPTALVGFLVLPAFVWCWRSGGSLPIGLGIAALVIILAVAAHRGIPRESRLGGIFVIGGGDVKLLAVAAVALSVPSYFVFLIGAGVFGLLFGIYWRKRTGAASFPFGPALSFALWSAMALPLPFPLTM